MVILYGAKGEAGGVKATVYATPCEILLLLKVPSEKAPDAPRVADPMVMSNEKR